MRGEEILGRLTKKQRLSLSCWALKTSAALCHAVDAVQNEVPYHHANALFKARGGTLPSGVVVVGATAGINEYLMSIYGVFAQPGLWRLKVECQQTQLLRCTPRHIKSSFRLVGLCFYVAIGQFREVAISLRLGSQSL